MAWQLIYTSSARLLEAGRTGFGTVARHRAISALLTGKLESISQFAQLPGYDPARVIFSHRIMEVYARRFHVLSCIRSAGSDYSGRTNHIAHHLVVTEEEVRELCQRSVTPVDVLRAMEWRTSWDSAARFLEESDEVDLSQLTPNMIEVWSGVTGLADHARLPWSPQAAKGCIIVIPKHADACLFAGEALTHNPQQSWEISFTTHLEPNDGVSDFRWVFLYPDSVARGQAEQSARPLYDLTVPSFLPEPPAPVQAVATATPSPKRQAAPPPSFAPPPPSGMDPGSQWGMEKLVHTKVGQRIVAAGPSAAGGRTSQAAAKKNRYTRALIAAACVMVAAVVCLGYQTHTKLKQERERLVKLVNDIWHDEFKHEGKVLLINKIKNANSDEIKQIELNIEELKNLERYISLSLQGDTEQIAPTITNPENPMVVDFIVLNKSVEKWLSFRKELRDKLQNNPFDWNGLSEALRKEDNAWKAIPEYPRKGEQPQDLLAKAKITVIRTLNEQAVALKDIKKVEGVLNQLELHSDVKVKAIMDCWNKIVTLKNEEVLQQAEYERWKWSSDLPEWLKAEVEKRKPQPIIAKPIQESLPAETKLAIQVSPASMQDLEKSKLESKNLPEPVETYFVFLNEDNTINSPEIPIKQGMLLEVEDLISKNASIKLFLEMEESGKVFLAKPAKMSQANQGLKFLDKRLDALPKEGYLEKDRVKINCKKGFRVVSRIGETEKLKIIAIDIRDNPPNQPLTADQEGRIISTESKGYGFSLKPGLEKIKWPDTANVKYYLTLTNPGNNAPNNAMALKAMHDQGHSFEFEQDLTEYNNQKRTIQSEINKKNIHLSELKKQIEKEGANIYELETNKERKAKDTNREELERARKKKIDLENNKKQVEEEIKAREAQLNTPPPKPIKPAAGSYCLLVKVNNRHFKLCQVELK